MNRLSIIPLAAAMTLGVAVAAHAQSSNEIRKGENPWPRIDWSKTGEQRPADTQISNNCQFGERIDDSTATEARRRIEAAGFANVQGLRKGCDNVWHATATANGYGVNVALTPDGQVFRETN